LLNLYRQSEYRNVNILLQVEISVLHINVKIPSNLCYIFKIKYMVDPKL
jgi:hypothetical protein